MLRIAPNAAIAVVDDDEAVRAALSFALQAEGYRVQSFATAEALLGASELMGFDCYVVDLRLPTLDGLSTIRSLRERGVGAPTILVTTQPDARCRAEAKALATPIVEKPLMGEGLSEEIRRLVLPYLSQ